MEMPRQRIDKDPWNSDKDPNKKIILKLISQYRSDETRKEIIKKIRYLISFLYTNFGIKFILDYSADNIKDLILDIEEMDIQRITKRKYRSALKDFISEALDPYLSVGKDYNNIKYDYILSDKTLKRGGGFSEGGYTMKKTFMTAEDIQSLIEKALNCNDRHYITIKLLLSSCRTGGLLSIRFNNVDFNGCFFDAYEKGTQGKKSGKQLNRYFMTRKTTNELMWYCKKYSIQGNDLILDVCPKIIRSNIHTYVDVSPRDFRRSVARLWRDAGMDIIDQKTLMSHKQDVHGSYSAFDPFTEPERCQSIFENRMKSIFKMEI
jgi:integrase